MFRTSRGGEKDVRGIPLGAEHIKLGRVSDREDRAPVEILIHEEGGHEARDPTRHGDKNEPCQPTAGEQVDLPERTGRKSGWEDTHECSFVTD